MVVRDIFDKFENTYSQQNVRFQDLCAAARSFRDVSEKLMPTSLIHKAREVKGMQLVSLTDPTVKREAAILCQKVKLVFPSKHMITMCSHYAKYSCGKMVSFLSFTQMQLNNSPGSIAISVDLAASIDPHHSMSIAIESIIKMLSKHRKPCVLFTQVANTPSAKLFWQVSIIFNLYDR